jgi:hypothetical protein
MTVEAPLRAIVAQHGTFRRREAVELGVDDAALRRWVRAGRIVRVRHGAYALADDWAALDERGRHVVLTRAVLRSLGSEVAASHHSACLLHRMEMWAVDLGQAHVTRRDGGAGRTTGDVAHHEGFVLDSDLVRMGGHFVVRPARAALESALLSGVERGLVVVNSALHQRLFSVDELTAQHALMRSWPGAGHLQLVVRLADGRAESVGESRSVHLFWAQRLPKPHLQYYVYDRHGELVGITDFAWPERRLLGEFDGKVKYLRYLKPGENPGDAVFREKQREDQLRRVTGWSMVRLTWRDLSDPAGTAASIRSMMSVAA